MNDLMQIMALVKQGPPPPEFLAKALNMALLHIMLEASRNLGTPPRFSAQLVEAGYTHSQADELFGLALSCALERTDANAIAAVPA